MMNIVSLFSGAMGLDLGLEAAGFKTMVCVENDVAAAKTIKLNRPDLPLISRDVRTVSADEIFELAGARNVDAVVGGPPCQAFSVFGNRGGMKDDRGAVIKDYVRLVDEIQPKAFLMENVRGLLSIKLDGDEEFSKKGGLFAWLQREFRKIGYRTDTFVVNSANYGTPQIRERIFVFGSRSNTKAEFPKPQFSNRDEDKLPPFRTLGDAIGSEFKETDPDCMNFSPRKLEYLRMVPAGGNWRHLPVEVQKESMGKSWYLKGGRSAYWRKLSFDYPSPALTTMPNHAGTSMCHPTELRALTCGESAAIQEFPPSWRFVGSATEKCRQIGNAVPTRLAQVAGETLIKLLIQIDETVSDSKANLLSEDTVTHLRPHVRTRSFWRNGEVQEGHTSYRGNSAVNQAELNLIPKS